MFTRTELWPTQGYGCPHPATMPSAVWNVPRFTAGGTTILYLERGGPGLSEVVPGFGYAMDPSNPLTWRGRSVVFT